MGEHCFIVAGAPSHESKSRRGLGSQFKTDFVIKSHRLRIFWQHRNAINAHFATSFGRLIDGYRRSARRKTETLRHISKHLVCALVGKLLDLRNFSISRLQRWNAALTCPALNMSRKLTVYFYGKPLYNRLKSLRVESTTHMCGIALHKTIPETRVHD